MRNHIDTVAGILMRIDQHDCSDMGLHLIPLNPENSPSRNNRGKLAT
jgi:hypothetical protein